MNITSLELARFVLYIRKQRVYLPFADDPDIYDISISVVIVGFNQSSEFLV
jgi:hypothetical protein